MAQSTRPEAFDVIVNIMRDPKGEAPTRLRAGELILAYSDGRPRQSVDVNIGAPRDVSTLSTEELEAIASGAPPPFALTYQGQVIEAKGVYPQDHPTSFARGAYGQEPVALQAEQ